MGMPGAKHHRLKSRVSEFLYQRITDDLCQRIAHGEWPLGEKIPGRQALAQEYATGLPTIQAAIAHLLANGLLTAVDRTGTFVARAVALSDYFSPHTPFADDSPDTTPDRAAPVVAPIAGLLLFGGYLPDASPAEVGYWGNITASAIERQISQLGGRTYIEYLSDALQVTTSIAAFRRQKVNLLFVVDNYGLLDGRCPELFTFLEKCGLPTIIISADEVVTTLPYVTYDQRHAGYMAARHLIECGYQAFSFVMPFHAHWVSERLEGMRAAFIQHRIPPEALTLLAPAEVPAEADYYASCAIPEQVLNASRYSEPRHSIFEETHFANQCLAVLRAGMPQGVIAANDALAVGFIKFTEQHGLAMGTDFGLVGFDDEWYSPKYGLTTLKPPLDKMGEMAARLGVTLLRHEPIQYQVRMHSQLILRASTHAGSHLRTLL